MIKLDFLVQTRDGATVTVARSVTVPDLIAIWSIIIKLARKIDEPGIRSLWRTTQAKLSSASASLTPAILRIYKPEP